MPAVDDFGDLIWEKIEFTVPARYFARKKLAV
jgi:hypothetical protein